MENAKTPNIGWLYYKQYYQNLDFSKIELKDKNNKPIKTINEIKIKKRNKFILKQEMPELPFSKLGNSNFELTTSYQGFLTGTGISHETSHPTIKNAEFKLGMMFEHSTGLPIIPGSTIKGVLRSAFPLRIEKNGGKNESPKKAIQRKRFTEQRYEYIINLFKELFNYSINREFVEKFEQSVFEGMDITKPDWKDNRKGIFLKEYKRDIFFDAVIYSPSLDNKLFLEDYITPHKNGLQDPVPLKFLKISPNVVFLFQFKLHCLEINGLEINNSMKATLFKKIIQDIGVGAKSSTGYGRLIEE